MTGLLNELMNLEFSNDDIVFFKGGVFEVLGKNGESVRINGTFGYNIRAELESTPHALRAWEVGNE